MDNRTYKEKISFEEYKKQCEQSIADPIKKQLWEEGKDFLKPQEEHLKNLIKGKRILIIGSGQSANDLQNIPEDALIFTCNTSCNILLEKNVNKKIDLHLTSTECIKVYSEGANHVVKNKNQLETLHKIGVRFFVCDADYSTICHHQWCYDTIPNNYYAIQLIKPKNITNIPSDWLLHCRESSSGVRLLQYALYYGAKEIYLIGIDNGGGYYWDTNLMNFPHTTFDKPFLEELAKKYFNIFVCSKNSPMIYLFPYKELK